MSRILVIEDEADLAETLEYNLEREGWSARSARTGEGGLEQAFAVLTPSDADDIGPADEPEEEAGDVA